MLMGDGGNESFPPCGGEESAEGGSRSFGAIFGVYEVQLPLESLDNAIWEGKEQEKDEKNHINLLIECY